MLAMLDETQRVVEHRILPDSNRPGERYNITFRCIEKKEGVKNIIKHSDERARSISFPRDEKMIDDEENKDERYKTERPKEEIKKTKTEFKKKHKEIEAKKREG